MHENNIERRNFLSGVAAGSAAALVGGGAVQASASSLADGGQSRLLNLSADDFSPHVGDRFVLESESQGSVAVQLVEATPLKHSADRPRELPQREAFSLVFSAPGQAQLTQDTFQVRHTALGSLSMFLVPVGPTGSTRQVEAVFA